MAERHPHTHLAYATKREGEKVRWLEIGIASIRGDGSGDIYIDRLPVGGFNGHVALKAIDALPEGTQSEE